MKKQSSFLGILMIMVMILGLFSGVHVEAASANVTIALSTASLKVDDSLTVTVTVKCSDAIGSYSMAVTYDSSVIEYTGGSGNGGGGTVNIAGYGDGSKKSLKASLKFKAVGTGSTTISTTGGEAYNWDEAALELKHAGAKVTVESEETASTDNTLASLSISPGTLSPAFSPDVTKYTVNVGEDVNELVVSAAPADSKATVSVSGNKKLKAGTNRVKVTVTAQSGDKKTYTISCIKKAGSTEASDTTAQEKTTENTTAADSETEASSEATETTENVPEALTVLIDGVNYTFAESAEGLEVPADFTADISVYEGQEILAFTGPEAAIRLVCLFNPDGNPVWFMYDEMTGGFLAYSEMKMAENRLFIMEAGEAVEIPEGYRSVELDLNGVVIPGFMNESSSEIIIVYAKKINGEEGLYYFDTIEGGFIRYLPQNTEQQEQASTEASTEVMAAAKQPEGEKLSYAAMKNICMCSLVAALLLLLAWAITICKNISLKSAQAGKKKTVSAEAEGTEPILAQTVKKEGVTSPGGDSLEDSHVHSQGIPDQKREENDLEQQAAKLVSKLSLDQEKSEKKPVSKDTAPVPIIQLEDGVVSPSRSNAPSTDGVVSPSRSNAPSTDGGEK